MWGNADIDSDSIIQTDTCAQNGNECICVAETESGTPAGPLLHEDWLILSSSALLSPVEDRPESVPVSGNEAAAPLFCLAFELVAPPLTTTASAIGGKGLTAAGRVA